MRLNLVISLIVITCIHVSANVNAQKISIAVKNAPIEQVFEQIQKQSGYEFFYDANQIKAAKKITMSFKNVNLKDLLDECFKDQPFSYSIQNKTIVVTMLLQPIIKKANDFLKKIIVSGKVTDKSANPLVGVSIHIKGKNTGTVTDQIGHYSIEGDPNDIIVFSYVGYQTIEIKINGQTEINMTLVDQNTQLDQVQVIGYGTTTRRISTGNVTSVKAETISQQPVTNPLQALVGRVAGLQVIQGNGLPGSPINVQIRGRNSITANNSPLFIIDGVPFTSSSVERLFGPNTSGSLAASPMNTIDPNSIESIEVLKDADATAIYGSRASNGVILITTKKGKTGKAKLTASLNQGFGSVTTYPEMLSIKGYLQLRKDALKNSGLIPNASNAPDLITWDQTTELNWQDWYMGRTVNQTDVSATVSGGNLQTRFLVNGNYHFENTLQSKSDKYKRSNVHFNLGHASLNEKLQLELNVFYTSDNNRLQYGATQMNNLVRSAPNYPVYDAVGNLNWTAGQLNYIALSNAYYKSAVTNLNSNLTVKYDIIPGLSIKSSLGYNRIEANQVNVFPTNYNNPSTGILGLSQFGDQYIQTVLFEPQLLFQNRIVNGTLDILLGGTMQKNITNGKSVTANNYTNDLLLESLSGGAVAFANSNTIEYKYISAFGRITYNWENKYIINGSFRRDGSSRFGPGSQFGNFGSIGGAWIFDNEHFLKEHIKWLSYGKLRASFGTTGSDGISDYAYLSVYTNTGFYNTTRGIIPQNLANSDYQWEVNKKFEIGVDLGFLNDKLLFYASWYKNKSENQLVIYPLPGTTGFSGYVANLPAEVKNTGWEFELNTTNIQNERVKWSTSLNITIPKNRLERFSNLTSTSYANTLMIGESLNVQQGFKSLGIDPTTGLPLAKDINKDGVYTFRSSYNDQGGDYINIGTTDPIWYGGINNNITFKGFQLDIFFQYTKQKGYNLYRNYNTGFGGLFNYWSKYIDYWKQPNDNSTLPKPQAVANISSTLFYLSDKTFSDASFLRLKTISLSYSVPTSMIKGTGIDNCRIYLRGQNVWTKTKYIGYDPESSASSAVAIPPLKMLIFGIQCTL